MPTSGSLDNTKMLCTFDVLYEEMSLKQRQLILGFRSRTYNEIDSRNTTYAPLGSRGHSWRHLLTELRGFQTNEWCRTRIIKSDTIYSH